MQRRRQRRRGHVSTTAKAKEVQWVEAMVSDGSKSEAGLVIDLGCGIRVEARHGKAAAEFLKAYGVGGC